MQMDGLRDSSGRFIDRQSDSLVNVQRFEVNCGKHQHWLLAVEAS